MIINGNGNFWKAQIAKKKSLTCLQKIKSVSLATTLVQ